jgi:26S proteasome regulatory subunit T4
LEPNLEVFKRVLRVHLSSFTLMDSQPSTSSGAMDQRRKDALKGYREVAYYFIRLLALLIGVQKMRSHEASSDSLKNRSSIHPSFIWKHIPIVYIVRFSLKDLEKEYAKTEEDIKAVQSVGQIVGEVMAQLDTDRCK